ncbi:MAG: lipopolysaccharide heptosyltransferase II [Desulfarculus sp.]|nr:lipopolysaccharide heptosyltransferase II [Pseudomonadota bacterium]MBV1714720.1 lipopolysaccharide heptosyltransferase II [Desulfarculus sp.]MBU4574841.1 lipopolysaccharide heptosyltransferase II [Pseudomonadota bacterium]MBU4600056.1 lipopolysaccharide heptosyltransferase II [Pseudomonadota bacterium]MBV1736984.1 lipopolysaccharide heptosyltransferase II [Desulfarculus sp.]
MRPLDPAAPRRILVRATNWVGDAVMTLPALAALHQACPQAEIEVLARPWAAAVYGAQPGVSRVLTYDKGGGHAGAGGMLALARQLRARRYDWAVLLQNAFEAALIAWLARIPVRLGYVRDGRGLLLTHRAALTPELRQVHETSYYLAILGQAGLLPLVPPPEGVRPQLHLTAEDQAWAADYLEREGLGGARLMGLAPGAAFGPAKQWPAERFATVARELADGFDAVLLFGSQGEAGACRAVAGGLEGLSVRNLAGATTLGQALALVERVGLFITNDSGLMHAAAALGRPTVAVFGSTNPVTTGPLGPHTSLVRVPVDCSPCLKPKCPTGDLKCFTAISPGQVAQAARELLAGAGEGA